MVTFLFSVYTITEAKQYAGLGRAEPGLELGRWILVRPGVAPPLKLRNFMQIVSMQSNTAAISHYSVPAEFQKLESGTSLSKMHSNGRLLEFGDMT